MNLEFQLPLLFDKEDPTLSAYFNDDYFSKNESIDLLSATFTADEFADRLLNELNATNEFEQGIQQELISNLPCVDNDGVQFISHSDQDVFRLLDELDIPIDETSDVQQGEISPRSWDSSCRVDDGQITDFSAVDEHDYAKAIGKSTGLSSGDESYYSSSESRSPFEYERQITSNSSSSSVGFDFCLPRANEDREILQPVRKQRRLNFILPALKNAEPENGAKRKYPALILTEEERQICEKEQFHLPSHYPLTKDEERKLRAIRRKIRNKASAQQSRKKKEEYIKALEDRAAMCTEENLKLQRHVQALTKTNSQLQEQMRKLRDTLLNSGRRSTQATSCLAVLLLSFALLIAPEYGPFGKRSEKAAASVSNVDEIATALTPGNTRTLLQLPTDVITEPENDYLLDAPLFDQYDNESIDAIDQLSICKKRKHFLLAPDSDSLGAYGRPAKKRMLDDGRQTKIELDYYKVPGAPAVNASPEMSFRRKTSSTLSLIK